MSYIRYLLRKIRFRLFSFLYILMQGNLRWCKVILYLCDFSSYLGFHSYLAETFALVYVNFQSHLVIHYVRASIQVDSSKNFGIDNCWLKHLSLRSKNDLIGTNAFTWLSADLPVLLILSPKVILSFIYLFYRFFRFYR